MNKYLIPAGEVILLHALCCKSGAKSTGRVHELHMVRVWLFLAWCQIQKKNYFWQCVNLCLAGVLLARRQTLHGVATKESGKASTCFLKLSSQEQYCQLHTLTVNVKPRGFFRSSKFSFYLIAVVHGNWGPWNAWSSCIKTCGGKEKANRLRYCIDPPPEHGGRPCEGYGVQTRECDTGKGFFNRQMKSYFTRVRQCITIEPCYVELCSR